MSVSEAYAGSLLKSIEDALKNSKDTLSAATAAPGQESDDIYQFFRSIARLEYTKIILMKTMVSGGIKAEVVRDLSDDVLRTLIISLVSSKTLSPEELNGLFGGEFISKLIPKEVSKKSPVKEDFLGDIQSAVEKSSNV